ncbi:MAG: hypothetical protein KAT00_01525 [Planctomycetes bacterium]|nr:hypothetical protein [Planctomycetota bacterium]
MPQIIEPQLRAHVTGTGTYYTIDNKLILVDGAVPLKALGSYSRGHVIRAGASEWEAHDAKGAGFLLVGDGTDVNSQAFDWDVFKAGAGADMVHSHVSNVEGGVLGAQRVYVSKNSGAAIGLRPELNFIEGSNITLTIADDAGNNEVDITIAAAATTGVHVVNSTGPHAEAGLTIGHVLRVSGAAAFSFAAIAAGDLPAHNLLSAQHGDTVVQAVSRGSLAYGDATPKWNELAHPAAAGYALTTDANDVFWDQTPAWTGTHSFAAGITFNGGMGANNITIPDNIDVAVELLDAGGLEYLRINALNAQPEIRFNSAGADIDFIVEAIGVPHGLLMRGSDGQVWIGALGAGFVQSDAAGQLSSAAIAGTDLPWSGGATQVAYWSGVNTLTGDAGMTYNAATDSLTIGDCFLTDGGQVGIAGNELVTFNAAGTVAFSGIVGITVEDEDWIGIGAAAERIVFDAAGDIAVMGANFGIGTLIAAYPLDVRSSVNSLGYFETTAADYGRIIVNAPVNADSQVAFMEGGATRWSIGCDGSNNHFVIANAFGAFGAGNDLVVIESATGYIGFSTSAPDALGHFNKAVAAGSDNLVLRLQNPTTAADARVGIGFAVNAHVGAAWDGFAIQAINDGVNTGDLGFYSVINDVLTAKMYIDSSVGIGFGTTDPDRLIHGEVSDAVTAAVTYAQRLSHTTSGMAAPLFGVGLEMELEDSAGNMQVAAEMTALWALATTGAEKPLLRFTTYPLGSAGPGYMGYWTYDGVNAVQIIIPNGAGDVTAQGYWSYVVVDKTTGTTSFGSAGLDHVGVTNFDIFSAGGQTVNLRLNADGSLDVRSTAGANTHKVSVFGTWI